MPEIWFIYYWEILWSKWKIWFTGKRALYYSVSCIKSMLFYKGDLADLGLIPGVVFDLWRQFGSPPPPSFLKDESEADPQYNVFSMITIGMRHFCHICIINLPQMNKQIKPEIISSFSSTHYTIINVSTFVITCTSVIPENGRGYVLAFYYQYVLTIRISFLLLHCKTSARVLIVISQSSSTISHEITGSMKE